MFKKEEHGITKQITKRTEIYERNGTERKINDRRNW